MRARQLLVVALWLQALLALGIGWGLHAWRGWPAWLALLAGLGLVALLRLVINLNNFRLAARAASPCPPEGMLDIGGRLRLLDGEFAASMAASSWHMVRARPAMRVYGDGPAAPVLLLHGYGCNSGYWRALAARLDAARISHATLDLEPLMAGIDDYSGQIAAALDKLCQAAGAPRAVLVAHSMGGLAARAYLRAYGTARVARVVTLGTPHAGTCLAAFGVGRNAAQMRCGSPWLAELAAHEDAAQRALFVSLYSYHDNIIAPQDSSVLEGARNIGFAGIGHVALGAHPRILAAVMDCIAEVRNGPECDRSAPFVPECGA